jgi:hypothetical protein
VSGVGSLSGRKVCIDNAMQSTVRPSVIYKAALRQGMHCPGLGSIGDRPLSLDIGGEMTGVIKRTGQSEIPAYAASAQ